MSLEWSARELDRLGRGVEADIIRGFLKRGDFPLPSRELVVLPTAQQLVSQEQEAWKRKDVPNPPTKLLETLAGAYERGIIIFEPHYLPKIIFRQDSKWPGEGITPEPLFWDKIKEGSISEDAAKLKGVWVLIDRTPKPYYDNGEQLYTNDPLAPILERLRKEGKIAVPREYKRVPATSRFAVSHDEISHHIGPAVAELLSVDKGQIRLPKEIEFNVFGNMHYREWGQTNTAEWFLDKFEDGSRLRGGGSGGGGLARVGYGRSDDRDDNIGFRLLVEFSPKS